MTRRLQAAIVLMMLSAFGVWADRHYRPAALGHTTKVRLLP